MRIAMLTNEYPPNVYGGAGVHVEYLTRELAAAGHFVHVLCFGDQHEESDRAARGRRDAARAAAGAGPAPRQAVRHDAPGSRDERHAAGIDLVHCHTWYTHLAGCLENTCRVCRSS